MVNGVVLLTKGTASKSRVSLGPAPHLWNGNLTDPVSGQQSRTQVPHEEGRRSRIQVAQGTPHSESSGTESRSDDPSAAMVQLAEPTGTKLHTSILESRPPVEANQETEPHTQVTETDP